MPNQAGRTQLSLVDYEKMLRAELDDLKHRISELETQEPPSAAAAATEAAQDAVGGILLDSSTIDFIYDDLTPTITAGIVTGSVGTTSLAAAAVTNAKLANMAQGLVKGRVLVAGTGEPVDLQASDLNDIVGSVNLIMADLKRIETDEVRARDAGGLKLYDDGGNGLAIEDGGNVGLNALPGTNLFLVGGSIGGAGAAGAYINPTTNAAGGTQYGIRVVGNPSLAADYIGIGVHGSPNFTNYKASIWIGNEAGRPGLNIGYAQSIAAPTLGAMIVGPVGVGVTSPSGLTVGVAVSETALGIDNVRFGVLSGTPRVVLEDAGATQWSIDNNAGTLRFNTPGVNLVNLTSGGLLGLGVTPQGRLHAHDGIGGMLFVSKSGIVAAAVSLIPDAAGDVTKKAYIMGIASNGIPQSVAVTGNVPLSGTLNATNDAGVNNLRFTCSAAGALTVARTAGTATWSISVLIIWQ